MKKRSLAIILALVLVMAFGTSAFAAQAISGAGFGGFNAYQATPTYSQVYSAGAVVYGANYFNPDGKSNYPYEIYLPNEVNPAQYRIHTNYTKNTDACASCHATHTAVGSSLLQWYSTYETCMACHDGTVTTTYDVESGKVANSAHMTAGGAFGNGSEDYASQHNVQGSVSISAAPGGSVVGKDVSAGSGKTISMWTSAFGCESCHTPHGQGGNARILNPDPNGFASLNNKKSYTVAVGGTVYDASGNKVTLIKGYPYVNTITVAGVADATYKIDNTLGYSVITFPNGEPAGPIAVAGTASIKVTMNVQNYLAVNETVYHVSGINSFCGTCHTDYNTEAQVAVNGTANANIMGNSANRPGYGALTGEYSKAHRHAVGLDADYGNASDKTMIGNDKLMKTMQDNKISCLTCHYAHGVNKDFWAATIDGSYIAATDLQEIAGSSALKRIPNMGTCEACHQKADANQGYAANSSATDPNFGKEQPIALTNYEANAAHASFFAGNTYKDATTCIICHATAGTDFMKSVHWTTDGKSNVNKDFFGGLLAVNDSATAGQNAVFPNGMPFGMSDRFCGFPGGAAGVSFAYEFNADGGTQEGNSCGKCHASIGMSAPPLFAGFFAVGQSHAATPAQQGAAMAKFAQDSLAKIDCLACHLKRSTYDSSVNKRVQYDPATGAASFKYGNADHGKAVIGSNAAFDEKLVGKNAAYTIQLPDNENCMTCHEHAMAGPVYKRHALYSAGTDIHAAENMECTDCHATSKHLIAKGIQATDLVANDRPEVEVSCIASKCHTATPHDATKHGVNNADHQAKIAELNNHTSKLACQSCHVKTETNAYANAAMAYVNKSQDERGYNYQFAGAQRELFKGGAIFNDFRAYSNQLKALNGVDDIQTINGATYGFLGSIPEAGNSEWMMVQPGNFAWRWFNGTGTGMANAIASFGFYDTYYYNDGFGGFRGTNKLPAPMGFGKGPDGTLNNQVWVSMGMPAATDFSGSAAYPNPGLPSLFGGYWVNYANPAMFTSDINGNDHNAMDKELYAGAPKGGSGDKIYPFRKMQAWMPVPRTNFWFLTPHDMKTVKTSADHINYRALQAAIESPMMYMFFSGMFRPAMDLYAAEFGFQYMYGENNNITVDGSTPQAYKNLVMGLGGNPQLAASQADWGMAYGVAQLNGYIYDSHANWLDSLTSTGSHVALKHGDMTGMRHNAGSNWDAGTQTVYGAPTTMDDAQAWLIAGQLDTYMYFPMPLDANIMEDHAIAAQDFTTTEGAKYEPRTCSSCHTTANATTFDNKDWNPLVNPPEVDGLSWGSKFVGTVNTTADGVTAGVNTSVIDWRALGYSDAEIASYTMFNPAAGLPGFNGQAWNFYDNK